MLSLLLGLAEVIGAQDLFIGANAVDYSGYPDCRPAFLEAFENMASAATVAGAEYGHRFKVHAPLLHLSKAEIITLGTELGLDYGMTWSCYDPTGRRPRMRPLRFVSPTATRVRRGPDNRPYPIRRKVIF